MIARFKVLTTLSFDSLDALENYLKVASGLEPHQVVELVDEKRLSLSVGEQGDIPGATSSTDTIMTIEEI